MENKFMFRNLPEMSKHTKIILFGIETMRFNPLEDFIGIVKIRQTDVEKLLHEKGFEDARKHIGF